MDSRIKGFIRGAALTNTGDQIIPMITGGVWIPQGIVFANPNIDLSLWGTRGFKLYTGPGATGVLLSDAGILGFVPGQAWEYDVYKPGGGGVAMPVLAPGTPLYLRFYSGAPAGATVDVLMQALEIS